MVFDKVKELVAEVMEVHDTRVVLRKPRGGVEWSRFKGDVRPLSEEESLKRKMAAADARRRFNKPG
jgi:ribosomal protein L19E